MQANSSGLTTATTALQHGSTAAWWHALGAPCRQARPTAAVQPGARPQLCDRVAESKNTAEAPGIQRGASRNPARAHHTSHSMGAPAAAMPASPAAKKEAGRNSLCMLLQNSRSVMVQGRWWWPCSIQRGEGGRGARDPPRQPAGATRRSLRRTRRWRQRHRNSMRLPSKRDCMTRKMSKYRGSLVLPGQGRGQPGHAREPCRRPAAAVLQPRTWKAAICPPNMGVLASP